MILRRQFWVLVFCVSVVTVHAQPYLQRQPLTLARTFSAVQSQNSEPQMVSDNQAGAFVVFKSVRGGVTQAMLYLQRVRVDGSLEWPTEGIPLCHYGSSQTAHQVAADGKGGVFVVWEDGREGRPRIYAQHINAEGKLQWGLNGVALSAGKLPQTGPRLAIDHQGGIYVFCEEEDPTQGEHDIVGQRLNAEGQRVWGEAATPVCRQLGMQHNIQLASTANQGVLVLWEDFRNGKSWKLYVQQFNIEGGAIWDAGGLSLAPEREVTQRYPTLFGDGFGGLVCVYEALGGLNIDKDIYIVRLNSYGKVVYQQPVCARYGDQTRPRVVKNGPDAWIVWEDQRDAAGSDIVLQRVDFFSGKLAYASDGFTVCNAAGEQRNPRLAVAALGGEIVIAWEDLRPQTDGPLQGGPVLYAQKLTQEGRTQWVNNGMAASAALNTQNEYTLLGDERGGAWLAWIQPLMNTGLASALPRYQHLLGNGAPHSRDGRWLLQQNSTQTGKTDRPFVDQPAVAPGYNNDAYIAWEDYRNGQKNPDIYLQRLDTSGAPVWRYGGIPVCTAEKQQGLPVLLAVPGGVYVAWVDRRNADDDLYIQFVDMAGNVRWQADGLPLCAAPRTQSSLKLVSTGSVREVLAVWTDARAFYERGFDIYIQRMDTLGRTAWVADGKLLAAQAGYQTSPSVIGDGRKGDKRGAYIAWMHEEGGVYGIRVQALDASGYYRYPDEGLLVQYSPLNQRAPRLVLGQNGTWFVLWAEERARGAEASVLKYKAFLPSGVAVLDAAPALLSGTPGNQTLPAPESQGGEPIVAWLDERAAGTQGVQAVAQKITPDGRQRWANGGMVLGGWLPEHAPPDVLPLGPLTFVSWAEERGTQKRAAYAALRSETGERVSKQYLPQTAAAQSAPLLVRLGTRPLLVWVEHEAARGESALQCVVVE